MDLLELVDRHERWVKAFETGRPERDERLRLADADLTGPDLSGAYLQDADLTGADLRGADLTGADITGADFTGARMDADLAARVA